MSWSEFDALCGLKEGSDPLSCCSPNLPVYPENVRPKNPAIFWVKLALFIIILGVVLWVY